MASPYHPHAQPGPSYYPHPPPPPPPPHYAYPPAPPPAPYYPYAMPPMSAPAPPMHQPASPRINGAGRGRYHRGGPAYHYPQIPQHHMPPTVPVQTPPPASPASPFLHPQKFAPHPHPHQVPYGSPYHHPQPNGPYPPHAWAGHTQTHSPLPKQLPMLPPMVAHEHVPQLQQPQLPHHPQPQPQPPPETHQRHQPALSHIAPDVPHINSPEAPQTGSEQEGPPRQGTPPREAEESHAVSSEPKELAESIHHDDSESIELVSEVAETSEQVAPQYTEEAEARAATPNSSSVDVDESLPPLPSTYVIWSRRPGDPNHAPGVIVSTRAYPPEDVIQKALELRTPPATPKPQVVPLAQTPIPAGLDIQEESAESVAPPSSTAETTPACSVVADTPVPGSPYSSATSVSVAVSSPPAKTSVSSHIEAKVDSETTEPSTPQPSVDQAQASAVSTSTTPAVASKAAAGPKKSWASLLQSSDSAASSSKPRLPVSNVVGFSIPASSGAPSQTPGTSVASANRNELLHLLHEGPSGSAANIAAGMKIRPRGLVNTGNMCFANAVLQILVYCPPFHRLFSELRRHLAGPVVGSQREGSKATPLVDATIQFLKEFVPDPPAPGPAANSKAKGKEREDDGFEELESFIPTYIYDAMKEKKRFANMIGGHQEDAEEFLGFYLDTLEEELLSISQPSQPKQPSPTTVGDAPTQDDGWLEVGKKNKAVTTRTSRSTESPITRIFGGKFRSSLRSPHQRESVTIEDWRSLQLDIQPEDVKTLRDALQHISHPQSVQISIPTRPGAILDATQQVLIDALPPVLILHMKRFLYDTKVGDVVKVGKQVSFSQELDIPSEIISPAKRTSQGIKYQLFGVLYHHGLSASGGHYTLDVLHPNRELSDRPRAAWIRIDDELVSDLRPEDVFGGQEREDRQPYLLFYRRMTAWGSARTN